MISRSVLKQIAPHARDKIVDDLEKYFDKYLQEYEVNTLLRVSHFLAQAAHESDSFKTLEEYASGLAYEGRKDLGNTQTGDGRRFKGRGIIQLTGRANYREYGKALGVDLENNPDLAKDPEISVRTALEYWKRKKLNSFADKDDILTITRRINGGTNGLDDRKKYLDRAKRELKDFDFSSTSKQSDVVILAQRGEKSDYVATIQTLLAEKGYDYVDIDGDFGPKTERAVRDFQMTESLPVTGKVDEETISRLMS